MFKEVVWKDDGKKVVLYSFMRWSVRCKKSHIRGSRKTKCILFPGPRERGGSAHHLGLHGGAPGQSGGKEREQKST